jgi:hypothetical protein
MVLICSPKNNNNDIFTMSYKSMELDPFLLFSNAIRSNQTKEKYQRRLNIFFDFIALPVDVSLNERCRVFIKNSQENSIYSPEYCFSIYFASKGEL